jgi:hypothetical protein
MKYQIRKRENVTVYLASEVATLDDEVFKNLEVNPYTGNSEEEFLKYISDLDMWDLPFDLDTDQMTELEKLHPDYVEMTEFANSAEKGCNSWFESGEVNEQYRRYGNFNVNFSSNEII